MSVIRRFNWKGQGRADVPHLKMIDSAAADDWDVYVGAMVAGGTPYVLKGFAMVAATTGTPATNLQLSVAGGLLVHPLSTATGTLFAPAVGRTVETLSVTNTRVQGSFTAGTTNYVGIDLVRSEDPTTADLVQFLDVDTLQETPKDVPLGLTLDYAIVISTQPFSTTPTLAPIAKVTTDANNNLASDGLVDARGILWRLGAGGDLPAAGHAYPWPGGRTETGLNTDFLAGDKAIDNQKAWMDAVMTRLWETGGGEHWYSPTADRNVHLVYNGTTFFSNGEYYEWSGTNLHWRELRFVFDNSTAYYNDVADQTSDSPGLTDLADGQCIYVDLDRTANRTGGSALVAQKGTVATLGTPAVPGARYVIAWRIGSSVFARDRAYAVGATFNPATTSAIGMVKLSATPGAPSAPVVFNPDANGMLTVAASGGNANGITATGNGTGAGIKATGGATGPAIVTQGVTGNDAPQVKRLDSAGNVRQVDDHNGYTMGRNMVVQENWIYSIGTVTTGAPTMISGTPWQVYVATGNGGSVTISNPSTAYPAPMLSLNIPNALQQIILSSAIPVVAAASFVSAVLEWEMGQSFAPTLSTVAVGLNDNPTGGSGEITISSLAGGAWTANTHSGSSGTSTGTGVTTALSATPNTRCRIELHGSASPYGTLTARFFVNETLVAITTNVPTTALYLHISYITSGATGGTGALTVGPMRLVVNRMLSEPAL